LTIKYKQFKSSEKSKKGENMNTETNTVESATFSAVNRLVWMLAGVLLGHTILQTFFPSPPEMTGEACRLAKMIEVGHVYEAVMVKDSLAVVQDLGTKKITLTQPMSHEVEIDNARLEADKHYKCIQVNLGDGDKIKLVISQNDKIVIAKDTAKNCK
jgi:hypothetical protein